jgi:hypothetical protein
MRMYISGAPALLRLLHSLTGPLGQPLLPAWGGSDSRPEGAPTILELGPPVSMSRNSGDPGVTPDHLSLLLAICNNLSHHLL